MNSNFEGQISSSAIINSGCRIVGKNVSIGPNCIIGEEGPVVIENCQLGKNVRLKGGYFKDSVYVCRAGAGGDRQHPPPGSGVLYTFIFLP